MKRVLDTNVQEIFNEGEPQTKVVLVENASQPGGISLVNSRAVSKKQYTDLMELSDGVSNVSTAIQANARNKLDVIGRQMKNLHELMTDVCSETRQSVELHSVACNFVKKPGHTYHLYKRPSGQKYFGMLSPEEWQDAPHQYLGSFRLELDQSWTPAQQTQSERYHGLNYLRDFFYSSISENMIT